MVVAYTKPQRRKKEREGHEEREIKLILFTLDLKMVNCRIQEMKKAICSINCILLGWMIVCGIEFLDRVVKLGKGFNNLRRIIANVYNRFH